MDFAREKEKGGQMSKWDIMHQNLQDVLVNEVALRREILSHMNQQEHALLIGDLAFREELRLETDGFVHKLRKAIKKRGILTRKLFDCIPIEKRVGSIEETLDPTHELESQTLLLYEQVRLLIDKIHNQQLRLKTLFDMIEKEGPLEVDNPAIHSETHYNPKEKRISLITIDYPDKEDANELI